MLLYSLRRKYGRLVAATCLVVLASELLIPATALALTSGPSQPEMQSFEPVGTTDMVDMFTGDFNYNIPLLDVEGYPINIAYHGGVNMEQEASWVGLGWNINPGNINHIVRGVSDDFKGDQIKKTLEIKSEKQDGFKTFTGVEFAGWDTKGVTDKGKEISKNKGTFSADFSYGVDINNYTGVSASVGMNSGFKVKTPWISPGINMGTSVSTANGADIDYGASLSITRSQSRTIGVGINGGLNSKQGLMYTSFGVNAALLNNVRTARKDGQGSYSTSFGSTMVPIGLQNYVPVITNASSMVTQFYQLKIGTEIYMMYPYWGASYTSNETSFETDGSRNAYGYFNLDQAGEESIMDFTRDKDGNVNRSTKYLPMGNMTYDIYAINGQGTGGSFRGFRGDVGTVGDPLTATKSSSTSNLVEVGIANLAEIGYDLKLAYTQSKSGYWGKHRKTFSPKTAGDIKEPVYLKQAGELSDSRGALYDYIGKDKPLKYNEAKNLSNGQTIFNTGRMPRANLLYFLDGQDASYAQVGVSPAISNYNFDGFKVQGSTPQQISRYGSGAYDRKMHHASEFTQLLPDGRRYVYGLPVMNWYQKDYEVSVTPQAGNPAQVNGITYTNGKPDAYGAGQTGGALTQAYYSCTETPAYAHSYMLTTILSPDYTDLTGDGISDDDLGGYTKFNYRRNEEKYLWRTPYAAHSASYNKGVKSNCNDDKASFSAGSREEWLLHSVETRNYVAEFYTSERADALGSNDADLLGGGAVTKSYKLDSIVLFNKKERFTNPSTAQPLKKVVFTYDYTLCPGIPNSSNGKGKLTLKAIYIKNGNSDIGYLSPYQFKYNGGIASPAYDFQGKDCWGTYKPAGSNSDPAKNLNLNLGNNEFPYVNQNDPNLDEYAGAWSLQEVILPSGGSIKVTYEADDYAYVQNKHAMEMFKVAGTGPTTDFTVNSTLYHNVQDPYLYIYFKRKKNQEQGSTIASSYLDNDKILQYTFEVEISPGNTSSCGNTPLKESVKGYAEVESSGICTNNDDYAYIKLAPKTPNTLVSLKDLGVSGAKINPITLNAINFARYYNNKALNPKSELTSVAPDGIIRELMASFGSYINFFENIIKTYIKQNKAQGYDAEKSYIRLVSQGLKKKGGGHRVKRIEFTDTWTGSANTATYGSDYDYTMKDDVTGLQISSGVASYEPLMGGDENPCRTLLTTNRYGNNSRFPPVDPVDLMQEAPLGESLYPPAVVGYRKVTVTDIHKNDAESAQAVQEYEFYTAKDFPVSVRYGDIETVEDRKPKIYDLITQKEIYRVAQGYTLYLNDMHGKPKRQSVYVMKDNSSGTREVVSYTSYNYFTDDRGNLKNDVPCLAFPDGSSSAPVQQTQTLGEETDITLDSREKNEVTNFFNPMFNVNVFVAPPFPISVPTAFMTYRKQTKTFSSLVNTKVVQRYGIVKSVESYDKGALVKVENAAFDPKTGQVLVTKVNTEHNDYEYSVKYPAYWAYRCMGAAYENIQYEENFTGAPIIDGKIYIKTGNADRFNLGDELELTANGLCSQSSAKGKFKLWVVDKVTQPNITTASCNNTCTSPSNPIMYRAGGNCYTFQQMKQILYDITANPEMLNFTVPFESVTFNMPKSLGYNLPIKNGNSPWYCVAQTSLNIPGQSASQDVYRFERDQSYTTSPLPYNSPFVIEYKYDFGYKFYSNNTVEDYANAANQFLHYEPRGSVTINFPSNTSSAPFTVNSNMTMFEGGYSNFVNDHASGPGCDRWIHGFTSHAGWGSILPIPQSNVTYLVAVPIKRTATAVDGSGLAWPQADNVTSGNIKVVRSGKRNQLTETVQEIMALTDPISGGGLTSGYNALSSAARKYTDAALVPAEFNDPATVYFNPYVTGAKGNYRVQSELLPHGNRQYSSSNIISDAQKGAYNVNSYWNFQAVNSEFYSRMMPQSATGQWREKNIVTAFAPWGADLSVSDATGINYANLFGYNHRLPTGVIRNSEWNNAVFENFEDFGYLFNTAGITNYSIIDFCQNPFRKTIKNQLNANLLGTTVKINNVSSHTGRYSLEFISGSNPVNVPVQTSGTPGVLQPFFFRPGQNYVVSFWQKVTTATPAATSSFRLTGNNGFTAYFNAKTPVIDGWVLYEGNFTIPASLNGQQATFSILGGGLIMDDFRILPANANMKTYVYDPRNMRLCAMLDETHMATILEYSDEGKLVRVKKETEKGILTLKESRESLKNILQSIVPPGAPNSNYPSY